MSSCFSISPTRGRFFFFILQLLHKLREFFFFFDLTPSAASWSRLRSSTTRGQPPLRSRAESLGLSSLDPQQTQRVRQSIREMEAVSWFAAQSARCTVRRVGMVLGGHVRDGPASPCSSREFQELDDACDMNRGSAFLCQLAPTDQRCSVGILTNVPTLQNRLSLQWSILERCGDESYSIKAHFQNHVRAFQRMLRSRTGALRPLPLPNRRAQCSGKTVWPTSTWTASVPLGVASNACTLSQFHKIECEAVNVQHSQTNKPFHQKHQMSMFK